MRGRFSWTRAAILVNAVAVYFAAVILVGGIVDAVYSGFSLSERLLAPAFAFIVGLAIAAQCGLAFETARVDQAAIREFVSGAVAAGSAPVGRSRA